MIETTDVPFGERASEFLCDDCGELEGTLFAPNRLKQNVARIAAKGWKISLAFGDYTHTCPGCVASPMVTLESTRKLFGRKVYSPDIEELL